MTFDDFKERVSSAFNNKVKWKFSNHTYGALERYPYPDYRFQAEAMVGSIPVKIGIPLFANVEKYVLCPEPTKYKLTDMSDPRFNAFVVASSTCNLLPENFNNAARNVSFVDAVIFVKTHLKNTFDEIYKISYMELTLPSEIAESK